MWPSTKPDRITPVRAMTSFRPIEECRNRARRVGDDRLAADADSGAAVAMIVRFLPHPVRAADRLHRPRPADGARTAGRGPVRNRDSRRSDISARQRLFSAPDGSSQRPARASAGAATSPGPLASIATADPVIDSGSADRDFIGGRRETGQGGSPENRSEVAGGRAIQRASRSCVAEKKPPSVRRPTAATGLPWQRFSPRSSSQ